MRLEYNNLYYRDPMVAGALIGLAGQGINALATGESNRKQREFAEKMYERQRADSLADWNMQNEYNSPQAQMARLKSAGLNPNMVYGNGGGVTTAQPVRSSQAQSISPRAPQIDTQSLIQQHYDITQKKLQNDNLKAQNEAIVANTKLTLAKELGAMSDNQLKIFTLEQGKALAPGNLDLQKANLKKLGVDIQSSQVNTDQVIQNMLQSKQLHPYRIKELGAKVENIVSSTSKNQQDIESSKIMNQISKNNAELYRIDQLIQHAKTEQETSNLRELMKKLMYENSELYRTFKLVKPF